MHVAPERTEKKPYHEPQVLEIGDHATIVASGGASNDVDNTFYQGGNKFQSFGPVS